ncbi:3-oxoacyl-[acyl-carrier-protein] reductase FabG [Pigmentiphaga humi]|uniref:3-oxoacyl-[acyl-carrier-protein] reductase FabG n=1 Tax=Pigmentiphaga humi TaxID=2478468 RepID=A0A3P4B065_9BURK|nr:SDR family oxidoreductase [Pigmentiphaga humi]VCU69693.1 3-oxoacyl-[acyl-carrier-protein] reductase FabG [Pigmentiphaga humi]
MTQPTSFAPQDSLAGRVAVIAGGTGAIGLATARRLAALGARCVLLHRGDSARARALLAELPGAGHAEVTASITDSGTLRAAAEQVRAQFGTCHILVNSAGTTRPVPAGDLEALTDELIDDILRVNFRGVFATIRAFAPLLKESGDGLIVTVSSIAGFTGVGSNLAYVAAKAGVDIVGDALAKALAPQVRVLSVSPGVVESTFVPGRGADFNAKTAATTPLGRIGSPDDIAAAIQACATTLRFATGTRLVVDGGRHL